MKKIFVYLLTAVFVVSIFSQNVFAQPRSSSDSEFIPTLPDYSRLRMDGITEAGLKSSAILKGKELRGYNGKSYIKPQNQGSLEVLDVRGHDKKGIAILVDFPVTEGNISDVPYVTWENPVEKVLFNDLLNGDSYNPYNTDFFSHLKQWNDPFTGKLYTAPTNSTLKNYYNEVSYGQFSIDVDVTSWLTLPHTYEYYLGQDKGYYNETGDAHMFELISDAIDAAVKAGFNFSDYAVEAKPGDFWLYGDDVTQIEDENGNLVNKIVPNIFIVHRGTGAEFGGRPELIWSHKWDLISNTYYGKYYQTGSVPNIDELSYKVVDGVVVDTYNICPEVGGHLYLDWYKPTPPEVGVFAHEFGHVLGLPDQYDYGYESEGTGIYTLMAGGASGRTIPSSRYSGTTPVHMDAWSKIYLGFIEPEDIINVRPEDGKQTITLRPLSESPDVVKIDVPGSNGREYFLLSNRQQTGFDAGLGHSFYYYDSNDEIQFYDRSDLHGLLVYHVVDDMIIKQFNRPNEAQNWDPNHRGKSQAGVSKYGQTHYGLSIIQADGRYDLEHGYNDGDAGDVFPGKNNVTSISAKGNVSTNTTSVLQWVPGNSETGIVIYNIVENADGTVTFDVYFTK